MPVDAANTRPGLDPPPRELPFFIHISKSAGNTMRSVIRHNYDPRVLFDFMFRGRKSITGYAKNVDSDDDDVVFAVAELCARQRSLRCAAGNIPYGIHRYLDRPVLYFTFLREPVERCISQWYFTYAGRHDGGRSWAALAKFDYDLEKMIASGAYLFSNDQTRMITGSGKPEIGEDEYQLARELIERNYLLVGAVEHFDQCLPLLARTLGWYTSRYERQNVGNKSDTSVLPANARAVLRDANEWDAKLHRWVVTEYLPRRLNAPLAAPVTLSAET